MHREGIMLSEIRERQASYALPYMWNLKKTKNKLRATENKLVLVRSREWGVGDMGQLLFF